MGSGVPFREVMGSGAWILAFDTSEEFGSVAVVQVTHDGRLSKVALHEIGEPRQQASRLVPTIELALATAGVSMADVAAVVVGCGPGSFTGVRIAASTAKGLVFGSDIHMWAPSSLLGAALGSDWDGSATTRAIAFDARGDRVYGAVYGIDPGRPPETIAAPEATTIDEFATTARDAGAVIAGSAANRHRARATLADLTVCAMPVGAPSAVGLVRALALDPERRASDNPRDFEPTYLRGSSAVPSQTPMSP